MADIVKANAPLLKRAGFKKRRYGFNRRGEDGVVHVVHFWMAPFEPPAWTEVPGLRERRYGGFRLDFGVWVPEMKRTNVPRGDWIYEYDCHLRATIGQLFTGDDTTDIWWDLFDLDAASKSAAALVEYGLPRLDRFPSRTRILSGYEDLGALGIGMSPAGGLDIAELYDALGRHKDARRTLERYVEGSVLKSHSVYLGPYLVARGYADLVELIRTR